MIIPLDTILQPQEGEFGARVSRCNSKCQPAANNVVHKYRTGETAQQHFERKIFLLRGHPFPSERERLREKEGFLIQQ